MITITALTHLVLASTPSAVAIPQESDAAWGRFRGPNGSGVALDGAALPDALGLEDNLRWKVSIPTGYSSPVLSDEHVFVTGVDGVMLLTLCFDRETGEEVWATPSPEPLAKPHRNVNSPAAPTPVTDGENVYVFFERNGLLSYDAEGELRWQSALDDLSSPYGMGTSPILAGDTLLLQCDHDGGSYLLALDKDSGNELWRSERPGTTHGFSSPVIYKPADGPTEVILSGAYQVTGYDLATGAKLWWVSGMAWQSKCLPVVEGDVLYVSSWMASPSEFGARPLNIEWAEALATYDADENGALSGEEVADLNLDQLWFLYDLDDDGGMDEEEWGYGVARGTAENGLYAIRLGGRGDITDSHVEWRFKRSLPNVPSPVFYDGLLYVLKEGGVLTSLDPASGGIVHDGRVEGAMGSYYASPIAGDGKLITVSQAGEIAVIEAGAQWSVLSVHGLGEEVWATPALDDGQVFVRSLESLFCFASDAVPDGPSTDTDSASAVAASALQETGSDAAEPLWPGWRGPAGDGIASETEWSSAGADEPLWRTEVGLGYSCFAVADGRLFTLGFDEGTGSDVVWCLDAETGAEIWTYAFPAEKWDKYHGGGTNSTPTLDGEVLYTLNREGRLHCIETATGVVRWKLDLVDIYGLQLPTWGLAASPVVVGDALLINVGRALLLDKSSGEERWSSEDFGHAYSTPALFEHKGLPAIALFNGAGLAVLSLADGSELGFSEWKTKYDVNAATPIVDGDEIFISSGYNKGASRLRLTDEGLETLWASRAMRTKMSGCVQIGDHLYGFDEAVLTCIDKAGEEMWSERGLGNGAVTGAGDRLLVITGEGELLVLSATPDKFDVLSRKHVIDSEGVFWTMPVLANGLIYCRDSRGQLVCLDHRAR